MSKKRTIYVGGGREAAETLSKAQPYGVEIIHFQRKEQLKPEILPLIGSAVLIDYDDIGLATAIARTLHERLPLNGVLSLSEDGLVPAAAIGEALGFRWNSLHTALTLRDKPRMREVLRKAGFSLVAARVGRTAEDLRSFARSQEAPIIVKPTNASGSLGVFRIDEEACCDEVWQRLQPLHLQEFLMEEYLDGPEISVESFSCNGVHVILAITDKLILPNHVEIGHSMPSALDASTRAAVTRFTQDFLDVVELREGPAHTEIKLTRKGPRIVESHNRPGGDRINELARMITGFDMKAASFGRICGLDAPLTQPPPAVGGAAIRFLVPRPGVVRAISGEDRVRSSDGFVELRLNLKVGDRIRPINESYDRVGYVIAHGASSAEASARCESMLRMLNICSEPGFEDLDPAWRRHEA